MIVLILLYLWTKGKKALVPPKFSRFDIKYEQKRIDERAVG